MTFATLLRGSAAAFSLASALGVASAAGAAPVIVNGSFEDPVEATNSLTEITHTGIPGWTGDSIGGVTHEYIINGNIEDLSGNLYGTTPFGDQYLGLNAIANRSFRSIESQVITGLTAGDSYTLTLYFANLDGAPDPNLSVAIGDGPDGTGTEEAYDLFTAPVEGPYGDGVIDFVEETVEFTALSDTSTLSIGNQSYTGVLGVDNVSIASLDDTPGVPEPATWAMLLSGFGLIGAAARYRRTGHRAAA